MVYLTYNDPPSGIYYSQVSDVCRFLQQELKVPVTLVSVISMRNFFSDRRKIKASYSPSVVLPMFPGPQNWKWNRFYYFLFLFLRCSTILARGPYATALALGWKRWGIVNRVCFDARGAYNAELNEYDVTGRTGMRKEIKVIEEAAIRHADACLSVSEKLVDYWRKEYGYTGGKHVVIPCTLNSEFFGKNIDEDQRSAARQKSGFRKEEIVLVYSGSASGWQSLVLLKDFLDSTLSSQPAIRILLLMKDAGPLSELCTRYPDRIVKKNVPEQEIPGWLAAADYGLLIRENTVTNRVASPVKYAEYLCAGLQVLISEELGDYSKFTADHLCGMIWRKGADLSILEPAGAEERRKNHELAMKYFSKEAFREAYSKLIGK